MGGVAVGDSQSPTELEAYIHMENFDAMAKKFDTDRRIERAKAISDEIRLQVLDGRNKSALEYGCGTGLIGFQLICDFKSMLFVDSSVGMIEQVKQKLLNAGKPADSAILHDFMESVPQNINVDYIFSSLVLHHIKDTKTILSRLYSVLNNEGHFFMVDINTDDGGFHAKYPDYDGHNGFEQSFITSLAKDVGFRKVDIKTFYNGSKIFDGKDKPYSLFILNAQK